ncbi:hypothetical protein LguiA_029197 [Lonicera macranthoides]
MMVRTRLLWFTVGFGSATAAMTHFIFRDLFNDRHSLSSQEKFDALNTRVSNLEQPVLAENSTPNQLFYASGNHPGFPWKGLRQFELKPCSTIMRL